ncbi:MAG: hypothetical protein ACRD18_08235 [Terriglobia bacterium]
MAKLFVVEEDVAQSFVVKTLRRFRIYRRKYRRVLTAKRCATSLEIKEMEEIDEARVVGCALRKACDAHGVR